MWFVNYSFCLCTQQSRADPQSTEYAYYISTNIKAMFDLNEVANLNRENLDFRKVHLSKINTNKKM